MIIKDILSLDAEIKVLSGESGLNRKISYVDVVEIPEGMHWVSTGDLIITTGYCFASNRSLFETFVKTLIAKGVVGLCIKLEKYIGSLTESIYHLSNENSFPIIEIPTHFSYRELLLPFMNRLLQDQKDSNYYSNPKTFYREIFNGRLKDEHIIFANALHFGIPSSAYYYVILLEHNKKNGDDIIENLASFLLNLNCLSICYTDPIDRISSIVITQIYNNRSQKFKYVCLDLKKQLSIFSKEQQVIIALSDLCHSLLEIPYAITYTKSLINIGKQLCPNKCYFDFEEHFLDLLLSENQGHYSFIYLKRRYIDPLITNDSKDKSDLLETLIALTTHQFIVTEAAKSLFLHRNTLYNRIKQLESVLCCDLKNPTIQQALTIACRNYNLAQLDPRLIKTIKI